MASNNTGLPDNLKDGIERLSGYAMDEVKVHYNSTVPRQLHAHAFAKGNEIHISSGEERHLPHEAWHVVQQKQGRVKPTLQLQNNLAVNDDSGLEREADIMGAKAVQMPVVSSQALVAPQQATTPSSSGLIQQKAFEYEGHTLDSENLVAFRQWALTMARVNMDRLKAIIPFLAKTSELSKDEAWQLIGIVKDTLENYLSEQEQMSLPIRSTVYGLDKAKGKQGQENVKLAYQQGFRDFDAAYMYQNGATAGLFKDLVINQGIIRIIYKFKLAEADGALDDLKNLSKITGVRIHTIMLHEIPASKLDKQAAFKQLKLMSMTFNAKVGLSNVEELDIESGDNFSSLLKMAGEEDLEISSVQNRVSPSAPDTQVRKMCEKLGIDYLGFGLKGGDEGGHEGTCSMGSESKVENYDITTDPLFVAKANQLGIPKEEFRHVMLDWGRSKGIKVISSSRNDKGMADMRARFSSEIVHILEMYGHGNEYYANSPDSSKIAKAPLYHPFVEYIKTEKLAGLIDPILSLAPIPMWRLYYKHSIAGKGDKSLKGALDKAGKSGIKDIIGLARYEFPNGITDVTKLSNVFGMYLQGLRAGYKGEVYPESCDSAELAALGTGKTINGSLKSISDYVEFLDDATLAVKFLNKQTEGTIVYLFIKTEVQASYKKVGTTWVKQ